MSVGWSVRPKTQFEFLALRPFSLSKLALIDADEDDDEEDDEEDDDDDDEEEDEKDDIFQKNIFFHFFYFFQIFHFFQIKIYFLIGALKFRCQLFNSSRTLGMQTKCFLYIECSILS